MFSGNMYMVCAENNQGRTIESTREIEGEGGTANVVSTWTSSLVLRSMTRPQQEIWVHFDLYAIRSVAKPQPARLLTTKVQNTSDSIESYMKWC